MKSYSISNDFDWWLNLFAFLDIGDIPENIKFLKNLQVLDISSNPLTK